MGMFDYVNFSMPCPTCGALIDGFQSKDGPCERRSLEPDDVDDFYSTCDSCGKWVEITRHPHLPSERRTVPLSLEQVQNLGFTLVTR